MLHVVALGRAQNGRLDVLRLMKAADVALLRRQLLVVTFGGLPAMAAVQASF